MTQQRQKHPECKASRNPSSDCIHITCALSAIPCYTCTLQKDSLARLCKPQRALLCAPDTITTAPSCREWRATPPHARCVGERWVEIHCSKSISIHCDFPYVPYDRGTTRLVSQVTIFTVIPWSATPLTGCVPMCQQCPTKPLHH